jgi:hypothetical protein
MRSIGKVIPGEGFTGRGSRAVGYAMSRDVCSTVFLCASNE